MHHLLAALLSLLVALCHHLGPADRPVVTARLISAAPLLLPDLTAPAVILPDRYQLARTARMQR